jgi:YfiH family protein
MTDVADLVVGVTAADCVPILYVEPGRRVAAAVHAGWRGTAAGVAARAITRMQEEYGIAPSEVHAALGPSIGPCCYEVGHEVAERIAAAWKEELKGAWRAMGVKGYLDLRALNRAQLIAGGVPARNIRQIGPCTACRVQLFFSYRKEGKTGSQLSFIGWRS